MVTYARTSITSLPPTMFEVFRYFQDIYLSLYNTPECLVLRWRGSFYKRVFWKTVFNMENFGWPLMTLDWYSVLNWWVKVSHEGCVRFFNFGIVCCITLDYTVFYLLLQTTDQVQKVAQKGKEMFLINLNILSMVPFRKELNFVCFICLYSASKNLETILTF